LIQLGKAGQIRAGFEFDLVETARPKEFPFMAHVIIPFPNANDFKQAR
jgi:hypothetical protein